MLAVLQSLPPEFWAIDIADILSTLLAFALFWVYLSMRNVQKEQNEIQENQNLLMHRQTALMAVSHQPRLRHEDIQADGDTLTLWLKNEGNGPAENLHSQVVIYKQREGDEKRDFKAGYRGEGTVVGSEQNPLIRKPSVSLAEGGPPNMDNVGEGIIKEGEYSIIFDSEIKLRPMSGGSKPYSAPFSEVMQRLSREWSGVDKIAIDVFLMYVDVIGEEYGVHLQSYADIPLHSELTIEECLNSGEEHDRIGNPISEEDMASIIRPGPWGTSS